MTASKRLKAVFLLCMTLFILCGGVFAACIPVTAYAAEQEYPVPAASVTMAKGDRNERLRRL